jgi:heat shock protein HslJ
MVKALINHKSKIFIVLLIISLLTLLSLACSDLLTASPPSPNPATTDSDGDNFRVLISDNTNAIEKFASVNVSVSRIGIHSNNSTDNWIELLPDTTEIDLKPLTGENAMEIWNGNVTTGVYNKVFIFVDNITGVLDEEYGGGQAEIKLPVNKLHISKSFTVADNATTSFVFDITVVEAGQSGKYILNPQIAESGADKQYKEVKKPNGISLENINWKLDTFGPSENLSPVLEETEITIRFVSSSLEFNGSAGCNSYFGNYTTDNSSLTIIPPIGQTEIGCPEPIMNQEVEYLTTLLAAESYLITDDLLQIICGDRLLNYIKD